MATTIDASAALLTYRAAWQRDQGRGGHARGRDGQARRDRRRAAASSTPRCRCFGGLGVVSEQPVERLYREIRALRIYEGATEVQRLIIARELLHARGA